LQIEFSLIERTVERELIPMAQAQNIGVTAWPFLSKGAAGEGGDVNSRRNLSTAE